MKVIRIAILFVAIAVLALVVYNGMNRESSGSGQVSQQQTYQSIMDEVAAGGVLLDVRTPEEYASGHIDGSVNLSLQSIQSGDMPSIESGQPVFVYCRSGNRSAQAVDLIKGAGFSHVTDLGAIESVQQLGGPIVN